MRDDGRGLADMGGIRMKRKNGRAIGTHRHLKHAWLMAGRNRKAYAKLSVTVILSFTLLLAYMAITDARLYNQYAKVFALPREVVLCYGEEKPGIYNAFLRQVKENIPGAQYYSYLAASTSLSYYDATGLNAQCFFLPHGADPVYEIDHYTGVDSNAPGASCAEPVRLIGEKQNFYLQPGEAIINESFYNALLAGGAAEPITIPLTFYWADTSVSVWDVKVAGVCADSYSDELILHKETGKPSGYVTIYLSQAQLDLPGTGDFESTQYIAFVSSDQPEAVMGYARALGMVAQGVAEAQEEARTVLRMETTSKALTAAVMMILLAINLYSSFSNVLETRKFEIGVKRAVGASRREITRQFLYESLLVLGMDTILSVILVADGMIIYKLLQKFVSSISWVAYVSPYSIAIYLFCSIGLTVAFSLVFAYQATQVEIVQYLKAE